MEIFIGPEAEGMRLDCVLRDNMSQISRNVLQKAVAAGHCLVDGHVEMRPDVKVRCGQRVLIELSEMQTPLAPEFNDLDILWQDKYLLICNKPAGLTVHPCPSCAGNTLVQRLLAHFPRLAALGGMRPGIVHRLDKDTSGLLVAAFDEPTRLALSAAFASRQVRKEYLALVSGLPAQEGVCREPVGRHPAVKIKMAVVPEDKGGKAAYTRWRRLWNSPDNSVSLLAVQIFTGRTHQIRVHMAHLGYPLFGDALYAPKSVRAAALRQMLHAWKLAFTHPHTGEELQFFCAPPQDVIEAALAACRRMVRVVIVGNPGSGKTALLEQLAHKGFSVFSADVVAEKLYARGGEVTQWLVRRFGSRVLNSDGTVSKTMLFDTLNLEPDLYRELEALVHPYVRQELDDFWKKREKAGDKLAFAEIPLYVECDWGIFFKPAPWLVGVDCPWAVRLYRLTFGRGWEESKATRLEARQWPQSRKMAVCDIVVNNDGTSETVEVLAEDLLQRLGHRVEENLRSEREKLMALW